MSTQPLPEAVLWDMDGTLVDTEPYWLAAEVDAVRARGGTWSVAQGLELVGGSLLSSARTILAETGVSGEPEELAGDILAGVLERVRASGAPWRPGALALLADLGRAGVPCALVTSSYAPLAEAVVAAAPAGTFTEVVTGDAVTRSKPDPEPYATAAARLGAAPARCVALEDSPVGVAAAMAAGVRTVAIPLMVDIPAQEGLSRLRTLEGVGTDLLAGVAAGAVVDELGPEAHGAAVHAVVGGAEQSA